VLPKVEMDSRNLSVVLSTNNSWLFVASHFAVSIPETGYAAPHGFGGKLKKSQLWSARISKEMQATQKYLATSVTTTVTVVAARRRVKASANIRKGFSLPIRGLTFNNNIINTTGLTPL